MAKKGHTEEQILRALRQAEGGTRVAEIAQGKKSDKAFLGFLCGEFFLRTPSRIARKFSLAEAGRTLALFYLERWRWHCEPRLFTGHVRDCAEATTQLGYEEPGEAACAGLSCARN